MSGSTRLTFILPCDIGKIYFIARRENGDQVIRKQIEEILQHHKYSRHKKRNIEKH